MPARAERSAGVIVFRREPRSSEPLFLLLDYGKYWEYPKGHVEAGEDDTTAALRELREETGIKDARLLPGFAETIQYFFRHPKRGLIRKTVIFFLAETHITKIRISAEHEAGAFLPYEQAMSRLTYPSSRTLLQRAREYVARD